MVFQTEPQRGTIDLIDGFEMTDRKSMHERQAARERVVARIEANLRGILLEELVFKPDDVEEMGIEELLEALTDQELENKEGK